MGNYRSKSQIDDKVMVTMTQMMVMMISFISMFKHAKGCGESALLALQVFVTREVIYYVADIWRLAPTPPAALAKNKRFKSSRTTWRNHVDKNKRFPLKHIVSIKL